MVTSPINYGLYFAAYEPFKEAFEMAFGHGFESFFYFAGSAFATAVSFIAKVPSGEIQECQNFPHRLENKCLAGDFHVA